MSLRCSAATPSSLTISYTPPPTAHDLHYVQLSSPSIASGKPFALTTTTSFPLNLTGLAAATSYSVAVRSHPSSEPTIAWGPGWEAPTDPIVCSTAAATAESRAPPPFGRTAAGSQFVRAYRISEYSFDVDFLPNHDAASIDAMPLYLMTCDNSGDCSPWDATDLTPKFFGCQDALAKLCPNLRGGAFACMACADAHRAAVTAACGDWSDGDTTAGDGSFGVHFHCGVGWPESAPAQGPITEYCVEYLPAPKGQPGVDDDGFAGYLSCNSDEVDAYGNDPRDPSCICICLNDRLLAHQATPRNTLGANRRNCPQWTERPPQPRRSRRPSSSRTATSARCRG